MRTHLGLWLCLTAGCSVPPAVEGPPTLPVTSLDREQSVFLAPSLPIRIGVEFLPATNTDGVLESIRRDLSEPLLPSTPLRTGVTAVAERPTAVSRREEPVRPLPAQAELPWTYDKDEVRGIEDPFERVGVRLVRELIGDDMRRVRRELGPMILEPRHRDLSYPELPNYMDERKRLDEEAYFAEKGRGFIRRPLRNALRSFGVFENLELALEDFKSEHLPVSGAYQENYPGRFNWGQVSMRFSVSDREDPLELTYKRSGWRFGTSQQRLKTRYTTDLAEALTLSLSTRYEYESSEFTVRANLTYVLDDRTRAHVVAGQNLGFFSDSEVFTLMESPLDGDSGVLFYVEHMF